jgi:Uma2 family endonuclease
MSDSMDDFEKRYMPRYENQSYPIPGVFTIDQFWEHERASELRYEFINGTMIERNGESLDHITIAQNIALKLDEHTEKSAWPHNIFMSSFRLKVHSQCYVYADVVITDGKWQIENYEGDQSATNPMLIAEVLSPLSEPFDKIHKFEAYQTIPTLQDYLIASQDRICVVHHHRIGKTWTHYETKTYLELGDTIPLISLDCQLSLKDVYHKTDLDLERPHRKKHL